MAIRTTGLTKRYGGTVARTGAAIAYALMTVAFLWQQQIAMTDHSRFRIPEGSR